MYKLVVLACAVAAVAAEADPTLAYANGLGYAGLPYAAGAYAAPIHAAAYAPYHAAGHIATGYAHAAPAVSLFSSPHRELSTSEKKHPAGYCRQQLQPPR